MDFTRTFPTRLDTKTGRHALLARPAPYFARISRGRFIGFRKLTSGAGSWVARYHADDAKPVSKTLGELSTSLDYDRAVDAAHAWFNELDSGVTSHSDHREATVESACRAYVADRRREKGNDTAQDAHKRFERTVYGDGRKRSKQPIAHVCLSKLRTTHVREWRQSLIESGLGKSSVNRTQISFNAALNLAVAQKWVGLERASSWRDVKQFRGVNKRRDLFLDLTQRRSLLASANGALHDLITAAVLTGARAGELISARVSQFDARTNTLTVSGKTGTRPVVLSDAASTFFAKLTADRAGTDQLLLRDDKKPWAHSDWDELVRDAAARACLPSGVCLYTLRHSWITQALLDGMSTLEVAKLVGTSVMMIERHYGHLVHATARERLARVFML